MINGAEGGVREPIPVLEIDSCHVVMLWQLWQCQQAGALQKRRIRGKAQELLASPGQVSWEMSGLKVLTESLIRPYIPSSTLLEWGLGVQSSGDDESSVSAMYSFRVASSGN